MRPISKRALAGYAGSGAALKGLRLLYAYAKPKFLEPTQLGIWNLLNLIPAYASYLHLGARTAMLYRLPALYADGRLEEAETLKGTVYYFTLAYSGILALALLGLALWGSFETVIRVGLFTVALLVLLNAYQEFQYSTLKAEQRFDLISRANLANTLALALVGVPLLYWFGLYGLFVSAVLIKALVVIYLSRKRPLRVCRVFDFPLLKALIAHGFPIMAYNFALFLLATADRILIALFLGPAAVGFYAVAMVAAEFLLQVPAAAREMLEPRLMASQQRAGEGLLWRRYLLAPVARTALYFPFLIAAVAFLAEDILTLILPRYVDSALPAVWLAHGCFFLAMIHVMRGMLVAKGLQTRVIPIHLLGIVSNVLISLFAIRQGWDIVGVAVATAVSYALVFVFIMRYLLRHGPADARPRAGHGAVLATPFIGVLLAVPLSDLLGPWLGGGMLQSLAHFGVFSALLYAFIHWLQRHPAMAQWLGPAVSA
jgi:O-antigen/teichoic acid export membrane protein